MLNFDNIIASESARVAIEFLLESDIRFFPDKEYSTIEPGYDYMAVFEASAYEKLKYSTLRAFPLFFSVRSRALLGLKFYDADKKSFGNVCKIFEGKKWGCPAVEIFDAYKELGYSVCHVEEATNGIGLHVFLTKNM